MSGLGLTDELNLCSDHWAFCVLFVADVDLVFVELIVDSVWYPRWSTKAAESEMLVNTLW